MKPNRQSEKSATETNSKRILIVEDDLTVQPLLEAEDAFDRLSSVQSSDESPYSVVLSDVDLGGNKSGFDLVDECFSNEVPAADVKRELSPFLIDTLDIPVITPQTDLGIEKAVRKALDWAIDQRESRIEWVALLAGAYACAYVFYGLVASLKHLPFKP